MAKKDPPKVDEDLDKEALHRQIPPNAQDQEMFLWLEGLFDVSDRENAPGEPKSTPDSFPDKIIMKPVFGRGGLNMGEQLREMAFKPMQQSVPSRESLVSMSNELRRVAQNYCNVEGRRQRFMLYAYSNLRSADAIATYPFTLIPTGRELGARDIPASDSEDSHRDRLLETSLAHSRWEREQHNESIAGVLRLQNEIIQQQRTEIAQMAAERRAMIIAQEDALSRKQEREERAEWAKIKNEAMQQGMQFLTGTIGPVMQAYLTKGKAGLVDGMRNFFSGLSNELRWALFGKWDENGRCTETGILDIEQAQIFLNMLDTGEASPQRVKALMESLRPDQMAAAQQVLPMDKIQALMMLAKAANDTATAANGASS